MMVFGQEPIPGMDEISAPVKQRAWRLKIVNGPKAGSTVDLAEAVQIAGRNDPPDIVVEIDLTDAELGEPPMMSRRHAELEVVDGHVQIRDLGSTNGTFLNGEKLTPLETHVIESDGVRLRFANLELEVTCAGD